MLGAEKDAREKVEKDVFENLLRRDWGNFNDISKKDLDWDKCPVLNAFIKEGLRVVGIISVIYYRRCTKDHKIGKIKVKKGTVLNFPAMYIHHNEKYYKNPEKFDVDRFSEENKVNLQKRSYLAFGGGARGCSGIELGYAMVKSVLVSLLTQFEVERDPDFIPEWS